MPEMENAGMAWDGPGGQKNPGTASGKLVFPDCKEFWTASRFGRMPCPRMSLAGGARAAFAAPMEKPRMFFRISLKVFLWHISNWTRPSFPIWRNPSSENSYACRRMAVTLPRLWWDATAASTMGCSYAVSLSCRRTISCCCLRLMRRLSKGTANSISV